MRFRRSLNANRAALGAAIAAVIMVCSTTTALAGYIFKTSWTDYGVVGKLSPRAVAVDRDDNVYVSDMKNHRVAKFDRGGKLVHAWGGGQKHPAWGGFANPTDIAIGNVPDPGEGEDAQRLYVTDTDNNRLVWFDRDGKYLDEWDLGPLRVPVSVKVNSYGDGLYVGYQSLDGSDFGVLRFNPFTHEQVADWYWIKALGSAFDSAGWFYAVTGQALNKYDSGGTLSDDNPFVGSPFLDNAIGMAFDISNDLIVTNGADKRPNSLVALFDGRGNLIQTVASEGDRRSQVLHPAGVALSSDGTAYVADQGHRRVAVFGQTPSS